MILGTALSAITMRLTRTMMLEVLRQDYIRTAWAKGLSEQLVVVRHALRNALIPVVTLIGLQAPILIGGAVIVEQIFVIPGMGLLLLDAISQRDYPIITGVSLVIGALRDADQSRRRSELRPARSQGEIPLMTLALDIPVTPGRRTSATASSAFVVRLFREKPLGAAGGVIFILFLLCGLFADVLAPYGMNQISPRNRLMAPSWAHPFGTDNLGRDMLSRCLYGAQISVIIAFTAATLATLVSDRDRHSDRLSRRQDRPRSRSASSMPG